MSDCIKIGKYTIVCPSSFDARKQNTYACISADGNVEVGTAYDVLLCIAQYGAVRHESDAMYVLNGASLISLIKDAEFLYNGMPKSSKDACRVCQRQQNTLDTLRTHITALAKCYELATIGDTIIVSDNRNLSSDLWGIIHKGHPYAGSAQEILRKMASDATKSSGY